MTLPRPEIDPELRTLLAGMPLMSRLDPEILAQLRQLPSTPPETFPDAPPVDRREVTAVGPDGVRIPLTVLHPAGTHQPTGTHQPAGTHRPGAAPCVYWIHGGGMVMGDRFSNIDIPLEWLGRFGAVVVTVDYRLAPEATGSTLVEDCYHGLTWTREHAGELGIDPDRIVVAGASAGGGLAAGVTLLARDRGGPGIAGQLLICPMLDHRNSSLSSRQFSAGPGVWTREMNEYGWRAVLGDRAGTGVPGYVSPAVADDLSGLPATYLDAGTAEVFRDEVIGYAGRIWAAGGQAELHVWAGGFHGFDALYPRARVSVQARRARADWLARHLAPPAGAQVPGPARAGRGPDAAPGSAGQQAR
ncbi:alpha/beta hydrolase [Plantactinospora sp. KBS50]|uniref:alpha/beta hydrolase n=1 Tax=Plantactinospora sp. KBS50 TaxID=2024580 RepID=UPI000BAB06D2|nr:alpha/beta hydrolase [Plantactinospora sp. KBS50]ASW55589.1 alpha/beta hydrolase [Plantactinospora sp. KBS50]